MKLALIGTGMIVKEALPVLKSIEGIDLTAILSTPRSIDLARELAETYQIGQATSDYEDILTNPQVDTVYVAAPNHLHYIYARQALLAGKHVICEKPFTLTLADFEDLAAIAEQRKLFLLEAITNQYLGNFTYLKDKLPQIGQPKIIACNFSQYSSRYDAFKRGKIAPAFDPQKGGGALRDLNIYNIHLIVGLFGKPQSVTYLANIERGVDTSGVLVMDYGHFKALAIAAKDCSGDIATSIQGNQGYLTVTGPTNSMPQVSLSLNDGSREQINHNSDYHRMHDEFVAFEAIIAGKDQEAAQKALKHSHSVMEVLEAAIKSYQ